MCILGGKSEGSGSKIDRAARGQEVRLPESSGLTNEMKMFWSLLNCRATAALAQICVTMCIYVHSFQASPHCMSGWLTSVYFSLPPVALCTSLPPLHWEPVWGDCSLPGGDVSLMPWAWFPFFWDGKKVTLGKKRRKKAQPLQLREQK